MVNNINAINLDLSKEVQVAGRNEITTGKAYIYCNIDENKPKEYEIEIEKIFINNNIDNKSMLIKVTDKDLIEKAGGIIQGMSGSPIIQNNKFVRMYYKCISKRPNSRICSFCRYDDKRNV